MEIGAEELSDEVACLVSEKSRQMHAADIHVLQWRNENVAQADDLGGISERVYSKGANFIHSRV